MFLNYEIAAGGAWRLSRDLIARWYDFNRPLYDFNSIHLAISLLFLCDVLYIPRAHA